MATTQGAADVQATTKARIQVIDTDVHETIGGFEELVPYLDPAWQRYITEWGFRGFAKPIPYVRPRSNHPGPVRSPEQMYQELVIDQGVDIAIMNTTQMQVNSIQGWHEFGAALASAYNDYQIEHWLNPAPWLRGSVYVSFHDPAAAAREIDRVGPHPQIVQVLLPMIGDIQYGDPIYGPIYEAASRHNLVLAMHHGATTRTLLGWPRTWIEWHVALPQALMCQLSSFIFNGTFEAYPDLKVVGLEMSFTWMPGWLSRMDRQYVEFHLEVPWVKRKPSEYIREHIRVNTQPVELLNAQRFMQIIDMVGCDDFLMFASDHPHADADRVAEALPSGLPESTRSKIMAGNALKTYRGL